MKMPSGPAAQQPLKVGLAHRERQVTEILAFHRQHVKFGRKPKLSDYQRQEAIRRRAEGETLASIAKSYAVDISMISRLA
jgi:hypothetical protein